MFYSFVPVHVSLLRCANRHGNAQTSELRHMILQCILQILRLSWCRRVWKVFGVKRLLPFTNDIYFRLLTIHTFYHNNWKYTACAVLPKTCSSSPYFLKNIIFGFTELTVEEEPLDDVDEATPYSTVTRPPLDEPIYSTPFIFNSERKPAGYSRRSKKVDTCHFCCYTNIYALLILL